MCISNMEIKTIKKSIQESLCNHKYEIKEEYLTEEFGFLLKRKSIYKKIISKCKNCGDIKQHHIYLGRRIIKSHSKNGN